jgi:flagellar biosynthesis/type III secretory pathway protein FliH
MHDRFTPLTVWLAPPRTGELADAVVADEKEPSVSPLGESHDTELRAALREVRRFRAALADALDAALALLLREIAIDVVGRELRIAGADVVHCVQRACERYGVDAISTLRVHPDDAGAAGALQGCSVIPDAGLRRGDAILTVRGGTIDVSLGARLERVLEELQP